MLEIGLEVCRVGSDALYSLGKSRTEVWRMVDGGRWTVYVARNAVRSTPLGPASVSREHVRHAEVRWNKDGSAQLQAGCSQGRWVGVGERWLWQCRCNEKESGSGTNTLLQ